MKSIKEIESRCKDLEMFLYLILNHMSNGYKLWYNFNVEALEKDEKSIYLVLSSLRDKDGDAVYLSMFENLNEVKKLSKSSTFKTPFGEIHHLGDMYYSGWDCRSEEGDEYVYFNSDQGYNGDFVFAYTKCTVSDIIRIYNVIDNED